VTLRNIFYSLYLAS